jgi:PAS domain S-box-containing protein
MNEPTNADFHALADAAPIGIFEADLEGNARYTNPAWHRITRIAEDGEPHAAWKAILHPDDANSTMALWQAALETGSGFDHRWRIVVDGEVRWLDACVAPTFAGGQVSGFVGTVVDVTALVIAETSLAEARDQAIEASRMKSEFIANISHEIRTPLNGVLGLTQILADSPLDPKQQSYVDTIRRAGDELLELLNNVLDLSKFEAGAMRTETVTFDIAALVRDTAQLFEASATNRGLVLDVMISQRLAPLVAGDPTRLRQVISNLVSNAIKFTDHGGVTVAAEPELVSADKFLLRVAVTDTGIGIPSDAHQAVFEAFAQGDSSTTRRFGGSGLGLSISKRIVEIMGGRVELDSSPGRGSTFTVWVPLGIADPVATSGAASSAPPAVTPRRVLVVEDNAVNQLVLQTMLGKLGHEVDIAENGADAVALAAMGPYDVIFMDCQMPVMDGYAATKAIRALSNGAATTPIVALTASAMPEDRQRCLNAGMDAYLSKPIKQSDLVDAIAHASHYRIAQ